MRISATLLAGVIVNCILLPMTISANASSGQPFTITPLVLEGDFIPGIQVVLEIDNVAINNNGDWIVDAYTFYDNCEHVLLRNDKVFLWQCQLLDEPEGAILAYFDNVNINDFGNSGLSLTYIKEQEYTVGIYLNTDLLIQTGDVSKADGFTPGTTYTEFFATKINSNNPQQILLNVEVDDPNIPEEDDHALVLLGLNDDGSEYTETIVYKEGDILPGQTSPIREFINLFETHFDLNDSGDVMFIARLDEEGAKRVIYIGDQLIAQEDEPSPVEGRNWSLLGLSVNLNNNRENVHFGILSGDPETNQLIAKNGEKLVQEGDILDGTDDADINLSILHPLPINDNGQVLWYGKWYSLDGSTQFDGLFLDHSLLIKSGSPTEDGFIFESIAAYPINTFDMSNNGRYIIFQAVLDGGTDGAFLIDFGDENCPWDLDNSGSVGTSDLLELLAQWGTDGQADFDEDGIVGTRDLLILLANWGPCG